MGAAGAKREAEARVQHFGMTHKIIHRLACTGGSARWQSSARDPESGGGVVLRARGPQPAVRGRGHVALCSGSLVGYCGLVWRCKVPCGWTSVRACHRPGRAKTHVSFRRARQEAGDGVEFRVTSGGSLHLAEFDLCP
jgi:hypothetical protein